MRETILFDASGAVLETEVPIQGSELPKVALEALKGKKIKEAARITNAIGVVTYEAEDWMFDALGNP